jgi:hypothetical protein
LLRIVAVYRDNADRSTEHLGTTPHSLVHCGTIAHQEEVLVNTITFPKAIVSIRIRKKAPERYGILIDCWGKKVQDTFCRGSGGIPQL